MDRSDVTAGVPMIARRRFATALVVAIVFAASPGSAQSRRTLEHRWGVGLEVDPFALPAGHLGVPLAADKSAPHLPFALTFRAQLDGGSALDVGVGLATSALGFTGWVGYERFARLVGDRSGTAALELYAEPGLQLGFVGPDYYARHANVFAGYDYAVGGPLAFGLRFPTGLRVTFARSSFDVYVMAVPQLMLTPSVDVLMVVSTGVRVRF